MLPKQSIHPCNKDPKKYRRKNTFRKLQYHAKWAPLKQTLCVYPGSPHFSILILKLTNIPIPAPLRSQTPCNSLYLHHPAIVCVSPQQFLSHFHLLPIPASVSAPQPSAQVPHYLMSGAPSLSWSQHRSHEQLSPLFSSCL